jgi:photosystem II stability/assembly factor-like uncharacterized protein
MAMTKWIRRFGVLAMVSMSVASLASRVVTAQRPVADPAHVTVNPALYEGLAFRPLFNFTRGGRSHTVVGIPSNPQIYYMGAANGGVFKTTDAGQSWVPITDGQIAVGSTGALGVADSNPDIVWLGTGSPDPRGNVSNGDGVYKSTDAGKTWTHMGLEKAGLIGRIRIHPTNPDVVFVAVLGNIFSPSKERGVYRTKDGGKTWAQVLSVSEKTGAADLAMDPKNPNVLIAGMWAVERKPWTQVSGSMDGGLFRSLDGGDTWQKLTNGLPKAMTGKIGVSISGADSKRVYAQIEAANDEGGTFRSDDGGASWTRVNTTRNLQQRAFYYTGIYADPVEVDTVYGLNVSMFKSTDGGKTFVGFRGTHSDNHDLWINPTNNKTIANSNDGGAAITLDGGNTWSSQDNQPTAEIYRLETDRRWPYWVYGAQQDNGSVGLSSSGNGDFIAVGPGESSYIAVDPRNPNVNYAGNYGGTLVRIDRTNGTTESVRIYADSQTGQRASEMKYRQQWNAPIRLSPHNPDVVYTTSQYVHRSRDGGQTWDVISTDLTRNDKAKQDFSGEGGVSRDNTGVEVYCTIFSFEESPATPGLLWAGSDDGLLHLSRDAGKTWSNITPPGLPEFATINSIDLKANLPGRAVIAAYRHMLNDYTPYIYSTSDYGRTWKRIADGKNGIPVGHSVRVVRESPDRPGLMLAGTEYGMYITFDDGAHWQRFQLNLPVTPITDMRILRKEVAITTEGRGFWVLEGLPVLEQLKAGLEAQPGTLFKPADAYRAGGPQPTFYYFLKDTPTAPVDLEVLDSKGVSVYKATGQPGSGGPVTVLPTLTAGRGGRGAGPGGGGGGGGRGNFGGGGGGGGVSAKKGLNKVVWSPRLPAPFTTPPGGVVMWGGAGGGPKPAPGLYTVKVTSGTWTASQTFRLETDPRFGKTSDIDGAAQLRMANEVGGWVKTNWDNMLKLRDAKAQAKASAEKAGASSPVAAAAKTFVERAEAVEGDITQMKGAPNGQDSLNFPGRLDNQLTALYGEVVQPERKLPKSVTERYADLKPIYEAIQARAAAVLTTEVAQFNAVASQAGAAAIVIK